MRSQAEQFNVDVYLPRLNEVSQKYLRSLDEEQKRLEALGVTATNFPMLFQLIAQSK